MNKSVRGMDFGLVLMCLLFCFYNLSYFEVEADSKGVTTGGHLVANPHLSPIQNSQQYSLSEFSEDATDKPKYRKKKRKKKNRRKTANNISKKKKKNIKKKAKKKFKRITKIVKADNQGPVDILVHIKMNE